MTRWLMQLTGGHYKQALAIAGAGVAVLAVALGGYLIYQSHVSDRNAEVSDYYAELYHSAAQDDLETATASYARIVEIGTDEQIALAALRLAALYFENGDITTTADLYQTVIELAPSTVLKDTATIRLAKVFSAAQRYDEAELLLLSIESPSPRILAVVSSASGDVSLLKGDLESAETYYEEAYEAASAIGESEFLQLLDIKIKMLDSLRIRGDTQ